MTAQEQLPMRPNAAATWFGRVVWLGIVLNVLFVLTQVFAPDMINVRVGLMPGFPTVWNRAHGLMVLALSVLYVPAARDPLRFPAYSWLVVVSRLVAAIFWAWCLYAGQGSFGSFLLMDGGFFIVEAVLLQSALPREERVLANIGGLFATIGTGLKTTAVRVVTVIVVALASLIGWVLYDNLLRHTPDATYNDIVQQYKYGAIGLGPSSRVPYRILSVLPDVFPEKLPGPGGYAALGLIMEPGSDGPVGMARRRFGYDSVEANCALCHTAAYRKTPDSHEGRPPSAEG